MAYKPGRHFRQIPGPSNIPDRILRAIDRPVLDHRSAEFAQLGQECLNGLKAVFQTKSPVLVFPSSATGAWEAALVNTLNEGDRILAFETGHFATLWAKMACNLGFRVDIVPGDWRHGVKSAELGRALANDPGHEIKAVMAVHNKTSTGVTTDILAVRRVLVQTLLDGYGLRFAVFQRSQAARTAAQISGAVPGLPDNFPILN